MKEEKAFDQHTREELRTAFRKALLKAYPEYHDPDREAELFVNCIEGFAGPPYYSEPQGQQKREEKLEAFANALDRCVDAALGMDDPALAYALWRGLSEMMKQAKFSDEDRAAVRALEGYPIIRIAYDLQKLHHEELRRFALGVRIAIRELPPLDRASSSFEEQTARWIDDYLTRRDIPCTTSETGLAGKAFDAVMTLAGVHTSGASYWLGKAAKNERSFRNIFKKLKEKIWH